MTENLSGIAWPKADYSGKKLLTSILDGIYTVLLFVSGPQTLVARLRRTWLTPQSPLASNVFLQASGQGEFLKL
jgi:hypothetical protein